jgi:hypothetical protein
VQGARRMHKIATQMIRNDTWQFVDSQKGNRLLCFGGLLPCVHGVDPLELIQIVRQKQRYTAEANNMMKCRKAQQKQKLFGEMHHRKRTQKHCSYHGAADE